MKAVHYCVAMVDFAFPGSCFPFTLVSGSSRTISALFQSRMAFTFSEKKESICSSVFFARGSMHFVGREGKKSDLESGSFGLPWLFQVLVVLIGS